MTENKKIIDLTIPQDKNSFGEDEKDFLNLSDEDLYRRLKEYDENIGPVTRSTRRVYLKKLKKFLDKEPDANEDDNANGDVINIETFRKSPIETNTRVRSTRTYTEIRRQGYVEKDEDEALVESDDEDLHIYRSYPASFTHLSPSRVRMTEVQSLLKSANETINQSNKSANDTLNSSIRYSSLEYSDDEKVEEKITIKKKEWAQVKRTKRAVIKKEAGWCGGLWRMLLILFILTIVVLLVLLFSGVDDGYGLGVFVKEQGGNYWNWCKNASADLIIKLQNIDILA